jgi:hypothetical protein
VSSLGGSAGVPFSSSHVLVDETELDHEKLLQ